MDISLKANLGKRQLAEVTAENTEHFLAGTGQAVNSVHPSLAYRQVLHGWLTVIGASLLGLTVAWYQSDSGLFPVQLPIFLGSVLLGAVGWIGVVQCPPPSVPVVMIVFAYSMTDFTLRSGNVVPGSFDIQSILKGISWIAILSFGLVNGARTMLADRLLSSFFAYTLFAFFSAFYSRALALGLGSGLALLALSLFAGVIGTWSKRSLTSMWRGLFIASVAMAIISLALFVVIPQYAIDNVTGSNRLRGVTGGGNSLGPIMSVGILVGVYLLSTYKKAPRFFVVLGILFSVVALVLTQSRASIFGLLAGILLVAALSNLLASMLTAALGCIGIWALFQPGLVESVLGGLSSLVSRTGHINEITSFTGRSDIWAAVVVKWLQSPWFGYGLGSPRIVVSEAYSDRWGNTHESAHNWLLESLLSFGVVGTALLVCFLVVLAWRLWGFKTDAVREVDKGPFDWPLVLCMQRCFVFCLVSGLMEKAFAGMPNPTLVLLSCLAGSCIVLTKNHNQIPFAAASPFGVAPHVIGRRRP